MTRPPVTHLAWRTYNNGTSYTICTTMSDNWTSDPSSVTCRNCLRTVDMARMEAKR